MHGSRSFSGNVERSIRRRDRHSDRRRRASLDCNPRRGTWDRNYLRRPLRDRDSRCPRFGATPGREAQAAMELRERTYRALGIVRHTLAAHAGQQSVKALLHSERHCPGATRSIRPSTLPSSYSMLTTTAGFLDEPTRTAASTSVACVVSSAPAVRL